ncbi:MAG: CapA family protein [Ruminococcaceae bacterium]|nr:CapA family protein [Oscillospiraceae bacterium]
MTMENQPKNEKRRPRRESTRRLWPSVTVAVLCIVGVIIAALFMGRSNGPADPDDGNKTVIHLTAGGDLNVTNDVVAAAGSDGSFQKAFMDVLPLLSNADISILNFEGNFHGEPYGSESRSAPASLAKALAAAGVDILQLANSCSVSGGIAGLVSTIDTVEHSALIPLGAYRSPEEAKKEKGYTLVEVQGIRIAFVAFTKGMDGMTLPAGTEGCINLLYKDYDSTYQQVDTEGITKVMNRVHAASPDIIVAMVHWGSEFNDSISKTQKQIKELLQENGADAIIGTHPHYVQKLEFDKETGAFVAYSLGDFFGDATRAGSEYSILLDLEITKNHQTGETKVTGYSYTPIFTVRQEFRDLRVMRIKETMAAYENNYMDRVPESVYKAMEYALKRIEARVKGES